jgi:hypothetical protein
MSSERTVENPSPVISGVPYLVAPGDHDGPTTLDGFLGDTEFTIDLAGHPYQVRGCGSRLDDRIRFHEKHHLVGKDIRVWHVSTAGSGFVAEHIAAF